MIELNKYIHTLLSGSTALTNLIGDRMYPLITPEQITENTFPFLMYERSSSLEGNKDGYGLTTSTLNVTIFAKKYNESISIAQAVDEVLSNYADDTIVRSKLTNVDETYYEPAYVQRLTYSIKTR